MTARRIGVGIFFLVVAGTTLLKDDFPNRLLFIAAAAAICIAVVVLFELGDKGKPKTDGSERDANG